MAVADVLNKIKEENVKFVDLRFTDTRGKEQHISIPASCIDEDFFTDGKMFDGSSMCGWKGINESDMILMPDVDTALIDPFYADKTMFIRCDVLEPTTMQGYDRDPRSIAKRAEEYLKSSGIADYALFGPEPEFFIFEDIRFKTDMSGCMVSIDDPEAAGPCEVLHPQVQPLQDLRPSPRLPAQLWHLPYLLPRAGLQGPDPRSPQGKFLIYVLSGGS